MAVGRDVIGQGLVGVELAEIDVGHLAEMCHPLLDMLPGMGQLPLTALDGVFHGLAEDRVDQEQHLAVRRLAALRDHVLVHVLAIGLHRLDALDVHHDGVGVGSGKLAAAR